MRFGEVLPPPTYPEYPDLLARAERNARGPVDPASIPRKQALIARRGYDWCLAVLGRPCGGLGRISSSDAELLVLADAAGIDPPLPQWVLDDRAAAKCAEEEKKKRLAELRQRDEEAWRAARKACPVQLEVRQNTTARVRGRGLRECLGHAVPLADAVSGQRRQHRAGRALCESESRARPLALSDAAEEPVTCVRCLERAPKIYAKEVPQQ